MLSHADLAVLAGRSYSGPQSGSVALDVRYDLVPRGPELIVVVPGTHPSDPLDWLRDLSAWPYWFPGIGPCHDGFGSGGAALWARLSTELPRGKRIVYTGHSLGGALAQVLAAYHAAEGLPPCRVVTFGAPRVPLGLNFYFGRLVRSALEAVEYRRAGDPVPSVPTWPLFAHPTRGVVIGKALPDPIANHSIALYAANLAALGV
ncbi:MAG TPA: hypothetical protein VEF90_17855 [Xanthobacteraceae bacterium]|nr:hypothetical protein [Xanthobacteraceae bacterium]